MLLTGRPRDLAGASSPANIACLLLSPSQHHFLLSRAYPARPYGQRYNPALHPASNLLPCRLILSDPLSTMSGFGKKTSSFAHAAFK